MNGITCQLIIVSFPDGWRALIAGVGLVGRRLKNQERAVEGAFRSLERYFPALSRFELTVCGTSGEETHVHQRVSEIGGQNVDVLE